MTDFTSQLEASDTTTGEAVSEVLDPAEVVPDVTPSASALPQTDDPYGEALKAQEATMETHAETGVSHASDSASLPQLEADTFSGQIFWLTATFILLYLLMAKSVLPRIHEVLEKRRHRIEHDLDQAERLAQEADESKADYERIHAESVARCQKMIADTEASIRQAGDDEHEKLDAELAARLAEAQTSIAKSAADIKKKLKPAAETIAQDIVAAMTGNDAADKKVADIVSKVKW